MCSKLTLDPTVEQMLKDYEQLCVANYNREHDGNKNRANSFLVINSGSSPSRKIFLVKTFSSSSWNYRGYRKYGISWKQMPRDGAIYSGI